MPKFVKDLVEKTALQATMQGGYVPHAEIAKMLGIASQQYQNHLLVLAANNKRTDTALAPFLRRQAYSAVPGSILARPLVGGQFTLPDDCAQVDYYLVPGAGRTAEIDGYALADRLESPITAPDAAHPVITMVENGDKQLYPTELPACTVQYYARVPQPVYAETYNDAGIATYDDDNSVDVGWGREHEPELIERTLRLLAQATRDGQLSQTANGLSQDNN